MGKLVLNGVEYIRSDPNAFPPLIYSTEEREIGVWVDGKPLYQKTIHVIESTEQSDKVYTTEITSLNPDYIKLVNAEVKLGTNGGNMWYTAPFTVSASYYMSVGVCTSEMEIISNTWRYKEAYVTIQYTKTTDTAGSGEWSTSGTPTQHYSETEHIVGTWIDGKPIYEKTISITSVIANDSWQNIENLSAKLLIDFECIGYYSNTSGNPTSFRTDRNTPQIQVNNGYIRYALISGTSISGFYITARYTKTTD